VRLALLSIALIAVVAASCSKTEEERVRAVVRKAVAAGNEKDSGGVVEDAAPGFVGPRGMPVDDCRRILLGYFMREGWIRAFEKDISVTIDGDKATAVLDAILARGNEVKKLEDVIPTNAQRFVFTLELTKIDGDWKFTRADYVQKGL
jgi:hypothetical protein